MTLRVDVRSNYKSVIAEFTPRHQGIVDKATIRALNRALDSAQTVANREIRKVYNVKAAVVRAAMKKVRANKKQSYAYSRLSISGARIPLIAFDARWKRGMKIGASVRILRGGARKRVKGAFIGVHGHTGARQVFVRLDKKRYPIKSLRSVSIPQQFANEIVINAVNRASRESFEKNFRQQIVYLSRN